MLIPPPCHATGRGATDGSARRFESRSVREGAAALRGFVRREGASPALTTKERADTNLWGSAARAAEVNLAVDMTASSPGDGCWVRAVQDVKIPGWNSEVFGCVVTRVRCQAGHAV